MFYAILIYNRNSFFFTTRDMDIKQQVIQSFAKVIGFIVHSDLFLNI